jgi:Protein of unknown function (DUF3047)
MAGVAHQIRTLGRRFAEARRGRPGRDPVAVAPEELRDGFAGLLARAPAGCVRAHALIDLPAGELPWRDTGLVLRRGDEVSVFAAGRVYLSKLLDIWAGPQFQLWLRVGSAGPIFNGTRDHHSFVASSDGPLAIAGQLPGQWGDQTGRVATPLAEYARVSGAFAVCIVVWSGSAAEGLQKLEAVGDVAGVLAAERARCAAPAPPPAGWSYLWFLGASEIFTATESEGRPAIGCRTRANVGILQREVQLDLTPGTRLRWRWRVEALPSEIAEDAQFTHDYLSIAVELSNGRDLTYTWSCELSPETGYWCPLPTWRDREFHVAIRSGRSGLGVWQSEERDLYADYRHFIGPPPPRIARVWLIANSMFQRREGRCCYADIALAQPSGETRVL